MKKIMFNDKYGLTEAVLKDRKTMTRRMITVPKKWHGIEVHGFSHVKGQTALDMLDGDDFTIEDPKTGECAQILPTYRIGEEVAVAQRYRDIWVQSDKLLNLTFADRHVNEEGWSNKMFVKADLMPHRICITSIKVERLQDISEEDCLKEGIQEYYPYIDRDPNDKVRTFQYFKNGKIWYRTSPAPKCFAHLIDDISGKGTWDKNPYVFVYEFKLIK